MKKLIECPALCRFGLLLVALLLQGALFAQYKVIHVNGRVCQGGATLKVGSTIPNIEHISFARNLDFIVLQHTISNEQTTIQAKGCRSNKSDTKSCNCSNSTISISSAAGFRSARRAELDDEDDTGNAKKCAPAMKLDKYYKIISKVEDKALEIFGASSAPGAAVVIHQPNGGDNQQWMLRTITDKPGFYAIQSEVGTVLDVAGGKAIQDAPLKTGDFKNSGTQQWRLQCSNEAGWYYLKTASNLYLDVKGGHGDDGTIVHLYTKNQSDAQKWKFVE